MTGGAAAGGAARLPPPGGSSLSPEEQHRGSAEYIRILQPTDRLVLFRGEFERARPVVLIYEAGLRDGDHFESSAECSFGHVMVYVNNIVVREEMLDVGVSVNMFALRLQMVRSPWGAVEGKELRQQPWVLLFPLLPEGLDVTVPNFTGIEIVASLLVNDTEKFLSSSLCGSHQPPGSPAENALLWNVAKFVNLSVDRPGLQTLRFTVKEGEGAASHLLKSRVAPLDADVFVFEDDQDPHLICLPASQSPPRVISMAKTSLQERIASIAARQDSMQLIEVWTNVRHGRRTCWYSHVMGQKLRQSDEENSVSRSSGNGEDDAGVEGRSEVNEDGGGGSADVAVCVSGAMRGSEAKLIKDNLLSKLPKFDLFAYILSDGTAPSETRLISLFPQNFKIASDLPLQTDLIDGHRFIYYRPDKPEPLKRLVHLWHDVDECYRLVQELYRSRRYTHIIRARPDVVIPGFSWKDVEEDPRISVPATDQVARWAHITDFFAIGSRRDMSIYMTIFRNCLYAIKAPFYPTMPRWISEVKLEACLFAAGVPWRHVGHWRYMILRGRSSCGSTRCWQEAETSISSSSGDGAFRYFHNGTRAF
ncbi:hypothetical protein GUITHDRAFT_145712 [Guillardia theta CCMP2712]|uniref:Uncharacterized protein n=1 Tax=Guillardia theta (strain CCMP2712) TaxID=905079 RepID=L1IKV2_GUITC|nr:hypothetical protein GUITHDRAFT_145712 [Guillardia theta CCMP2712]EKX36549.1 hypothetical protein GUITHDRAFT_145712 [Guillardia theta CCMP2712]|eukprot:XP_005823529.1 hypothetical protein GUITHDRAFT_145712 [Guillardia theta CCMP2712]